jgi:catechol 2,3-dioxygenase-like lactoylglutathione lyase family enzyme
MNVQGFSHVTINVKSLMGSIRFYRDVLGMKLRHQGRLDAYLEWGSAWICLIERPQYAERSQMRIGVDHVAFYVEEDDFKTAVDRLKQHNVHIVREPVVRGIGWSVNFLDPDGTELELHTSTLEERMKVWK